MLRPFLQTKHFCRSHLPDEKASQTGNPSSDNVLDPILELKQRRIVREKKCSTFIDINSCLQRFETASMQCRMLKVNEIQLGFASRIPCPHFKQCVFVHLWICNWRFSSLFFMWSHLSLVLYTECFHSSGSWTKGRVHEKKSCSSFVQMRGGGPCPNFSSPFHKCIFGQ